MWIRRLSGQKDLHREGSGRDQLVANRTLSPRLRSWNRSLPGAPQQPWAGVFGHRVYDWLISRFRFCASSHHMEIRNKATAFAR